MNTRPVIIDTDLGMGVPGQDVDDAFALALAAAEPELDIRLVTCVDGNTDVFRATRLTAQLMDRLHLDAPLARGAALPLCGTRWRDTPVEENDRTFLPSCVMPAAQAIIEVLEKAEPASVDIVALGPLTNIALVMLLRPDLASRIGMLSIMGGIYFQPQYNLGFPVEFNFLLDPEAANIALHSGIPTRLVGLDVTKQITFDRREAEALRANGTSFGAYAWQCADALIDQLEHGAHGTPTSYCMLHDPLAVGALTHPELLDWQGYPVDIVRDGTMRGMSVVGAPDAGSPVQIATSVDAEAFKQHLFSRLAELP